MRELSEEHALLVTLAERMAERPVLVTFNGKSFDWPLLETRYRMTRKIRATAPRAHLDFLHPARNLWRVRLGIGAAGGTGKARAGVESRRGFDFGDDSAILFRLFARRAAGAAGADLFAQSNGPARAGGACQPDRRGAGGPGVGRRGRAGIIWGFAHLRTARRDGARAKTLRAIAGCRAARGNRSGRATFAGATGETRRRFAAGAEIVGEHSGGLRAKDWRPTNSWRFTTSISAREPQRAAAARTKGAGGVAATESQRGAKRSIIAALQK